jgi:hypothetical protein
MMLSKMYDDDHCIKLRLCIFGECIRLLCIRLFGYLEQNSMVIRPFGDYCDFSEFRFFNYFYNFREYWRHLVFDKYLSIVLFIYFYL